MGSGAPIGHYIPAFFFTCMALFALLYTLVMNRRPEDCPRILFLQGLVLVVITTIGILAESVNCLLVCTDGMATGTWNRLTFQSMHEILYLSFLLVGCASMLEAKDLLPSNTGKMVLAMAFFAEHGMWKSHAMMQSGADQQEHEFMAFAGLVNGLVTVGSIVYPSQPILHIGIYAVLLLQGLWMWTIGAHVKDENEMDMHKVASAFYAEVMFVVALVMATAALARYKRGNKNRDNVMEHQYEYEYGKVNNTCITDNDKEYETADVGGGESI